MTALHRRRCRATAGRWFAELRDIEGIVPIDGIGDFIERLEPDDWAVVTSASLELATVRLRAQNYRGLAM